jgi:hypothetical protein
MKLQTWMTPLSSRAARVAGLLAFSGLMALVLLSPARAQETPEPTSAEPVPTAAPGETTIDLQLSTPEEPVPVGDIIEATVMVNNVEHLAGFDFTITYDKDKFRLVEAEESGTPVPTVDPALGGFGPPAIEIETGAILAASPRNGQLICQVPSAGDGEVVVNCNTALPPFCLGGPEGASGSGVLAVIPFESRGGGLTSFEITSSTLVLDDLEPCDFEGGAPVRIPHTRGPAATVELAAKDDSSTLLIVIIIVVVLVVVAAAGGGGYYAYRRAQGRSADGP